MSSKKTLIAGPWVGEFGWELFAWQAYIRALSEHFEKTIVFSRDASKEIYSDFCDEFHGFDPQVGEPDAFFMHNLDMNKAFREVVKKSEVSLEDCAVIFPKRIGFPPHTHFNEFITFGDKQIKPKYITFGKKSKQKYDYIFHIRSRDLRKEDNWSLENWQSLKEMLGNKKIACIGTSKSSGWIDGTDDLRDLQLNKLFTIMRNAKCTFGPSSGPMHLSSLCNCPHIVWSRKENKTRYQTNWNPLQTPILFLDEFSWHPSPEYIFEKFKDWQLNSL